MSKIAIIGSRGLERPDYLTNIKKLTVTTPFGDPNPVMYSGMLDGIEVIHLSRRGLDDSIPASKINFKANLYALKQLQCTHILAATICRSLQEEICPGEIIIPGPVYRYDYPETVGHFRRYEWRNHLPADGRTFLG